MKILLATALYPPEIDEVSAYSQIVAEQLAAKNEVTVLAYASHWEKSSKAKIVVVNKKRPLFVRLLAFTWRLFSLSGKADVIYVQNSVAVSLPAIIAALFSRKPVIINFIEDEAWKRALNLNLYYGALDEFLADKSINGKIKLIKLLQGFALRKATKVLLSSEALADLLNKYYKVSKEKIIVNYQPEANHQVLPFSVEREPKRLFLNFKIFDPLGFKTSVESLALLRTHHPDLLLVIAGDIFDEKEFADLAHELGVEDMIDFLGHISKAEEWYHRKSSTAGLYLNSGFDFSHSISKNFSAALPTVSFASPLAREFIFDHKNGILVDAGDAEALAEAIDKLLKDKAFSAELILRANSDWEEKFSWEKHSHHLNSIFSSILRN